MVAAGHAAPAAPSEPKVRLSKRGPQAWTNFRTGPALSLRAGGTTRLLAHVVADRTFRQWDKRVEAFLQECARNRTPLASSRDIDVALAEHMDFLCYGRQLEAASGAALMHGLLVVCPELRGQLPLSARSLQAWGRLASTPEGSPMCEEAVFLIAQQLLRKAEPYAAAWVLVQYDLFGREQDVECLFPADVVQSEGQVAVVFGVSARGETVKTGRDQGALIERPWVGRLLLALADFAAPGARIFPLTQPFGAAGPTLCSSWGPRIARRMRCGTQQLQRRSSSRGLGWSRSDAAAAGVPCPACRDIQTRTT